MSVIIKLLSKFDDSGIKKAQSQFGGLKKTLAGIGLGIGIKQVADQLMEAGKAAAADQKSMRLLNDQLTKNAHATKAQVTQNNQFIDSLSNQVGIVDDNLRPAMGKLVRATGSVAKAQDLLKLSLDASAVSGKPLDTVAQAISKAFNGNTSALTRMFPELKKSKDLFGDLRKEVEGAAVSQADPFSRLNVAMDNLKEKLGYVLLPYVEKFVDSFTKPGGLGDQISKFLDDMSNPKTDAGKTFLQIKDAIEATIGAVKTFFGYFGNGDAMKGFGNLASFLVKMLPALLALKGIMMLASAGKSIQSLVLALTAIRGGGGGTNTPIGGISGKQIAALGTVGAVLSLSGDTAQGGVNPDYGNPVLMRKKPLISGSSDLLSNLRANPAPNVVVNVHSADPKAVVQAIRDYGKQNGGLNSVIKPKGRQ